MAHTVARFPGQLSGTKRMQRSVSTTPIRYYYLQPIAEAAAGCGLHENNAKVILHRIRKKLKVHLEKEGFDT